MRKIFLSLLVLVTISSVAQDLPKNYASLLKEVEPELIAWRRHFHEFPELSNREVNTGKYIADFLKTLPNLEVRYPVAKTGVVAVLKGGKPGAVIALRADIDALPVYERVAIPFASKVTTEFNGQKVSVMHACGHDSHTAMLMATAKILSTMQKELPGTIMFLFQPAEEGAPENEEGGAQLMIKEGALDDPKVEAVFGIHISSQTPVGTIKYKSGAFMASSDWFTIKVNGKGSHGSQPWAGVDPIAASALEGLQHIVSRQMDLTKAPLVITVGTINSGVRSNIIPETAEMTGTIRTLDSKMQVEVHERIKHTVKTIAESSGATADVVIDTKTLVTYNDPALVKKTLPSLIKAAGDENVSESTWITGAEDFSFFAAKAPSFFFNLGGMPKGTDPRKAGPHHTPDFYLDESGFILGVKAFCQLVFDYGKTK
ncbi:MAG: amidohydrolase [Sediminibacterium sp.]|nr:amidohydrolase [Sediminibacterium sp.]